MDAELIRWLYMRQGDMLEYRDRTGTIREIGPISEIEWRPNHIAYSTARKKYVLWPGPGGKPVDVPLQRVQAVKRRGVEIIRFAEGEEAATLAYTCAACHQRLIDSAVEGGVFCSLACQQEWIELYYAEYPPGQNPLDKGEQIHTANCAECRRLNRFYCPRCVD